MGNGRITDPKNREEFKLYIRSRLGEPIIELNVSEFQVDQAVDEALQYYRDYHYNGSTHVYYVHTLTAQDLQNRYFDVPDDLFGVTTIYDYSDQTGMGISTDIYSGAWQMNYDLIFNQGSLQGSFLSYYINKSYYDMINSLLIGMKKIRFNMHENRVYLDNTWTNYEAGKHLILDGYQVLDPDTNPDVWSDRWLIRYAAAKLKRQWGENISKFDGTLPGGQRLNYQRIIQESEDEITKIEENCLRDYSIPPGDMIG